ncbi:MAG: YdcF family protein [Micavibrio sp.]|nr:YdcF family protein [Micavibrio sp.]
MATLTRPTLSKATCLWLAVVFLTALWLGGLHWFTRSIIDIRPPDAKPADAVVVLTGGSNRLNTGFKLLDDKMGKKLFISGVARGVEVRELFEQWKEEDDTSLDCCVVLGFEAEDTIGNARETIAWLRKEGYNSIFLVTANYHMRRAMLDFSTLSPDLAITPWPVQPAGLDMQDWWRDPAYRSLILREYFKYLATVVWSLLA